MLDYKLRCLILFCVLVYAVTSRRQTVVLLGEKNSGRSCFVNNIDKKQFKDYYFVLVESLSVNNDNENYLKLSKILNDLKTVDYIMVFYSLKHENSILENNLRNIKSYLGKINSAENFRKIMIVVNQRRRLIPKWKEFLNKISINYNLPYIHIQSGCDENIESEASENIFNYLRNRNNKIKYYEKKVIESIDANNSSNFTLILFPTLLLLLGLIYFSKKLFKIRSKKEKDFVYNTSQDKEKKNSIKKKMKTQRKLLLLCKTQKKLLLLCQKYYNL